MNIFTRKKKLLATNANLEEQIRIQFNEMDKLRKANTDLNRLWRDAVKENKGLHDETIATKEAMRAQGMEHAAALGEKKQTIEGLEFRIQVADRRGEATGGVVQLGDDVVFLFDGGHQAFDGLVFFAQGGGMIHSLGAHGFFCGDGLVVEAFVLFDRIAP